MHTMGWLAIIEVQSHDRLAVQRLCILGQAYQIFQYFIWRFGGTLLYLKSHGTLTGVIKDDQMSNSSLLIMAGLCRRIKCRYGF